MEKSLVNGIDFHIGTIAGQYVHYPGAHVPIECEIGRKYPDILFPEYFLVLEIRGPHRHAHCLDLVGPCDNTAVIIAQNCNGLPVERRVKHTLTRGIKVIAVYKGKVIGQNIGFGISPKLWTKTKCI